MEALALACGNPTDCSTSSSSGSMESKNSDNLLAAGEARNCPEMVVHAHWIIGKAALAANFLTNFQTPLHFAEDFVTACQQILAQCPPGG